MNLIFQDLPIRIFFQEKFIKNENQYRAEMKYKIQHSIVKRGQLKIHQVINQVGIMLKAKFFAESVPVVFNSPD